MKSINQIFPYRASLDITNSRSRVSREKEISAAQADNKQSVELKSVKKIAQDRNIDQQFLTSKHLFEQRKVFEQTEKLTKIITGLIEEDMRSNFISHHPLYRPITKVIADQERRIKRQAISLKREQRELLAISKRITQIRSGYLSLGNKKYSHQIEKNLDILQIKIEGLTAKSQQAGQAKLKEMHRGDYQEMAVDLGHEKTFLEASKVAKEIKELANKITNNIDDALSAESASDPDTLQSVSEAMNLLGLIFDAKADFYLGKAGEAGLNAHTIYQNTHRFKDFKQTSTPESGVASTSSLGVNAGVGGNIIEGAADFTVGIQGRWNQNKSMNINHDGDIDFTLMKSAGLGAKAETKIKSVFSVNTSVAVESTQYGDYYEVADAGGRGKDSTLKYMAVMKNDQYILPASIRLRSAPQQLYQQQYKLKNEVYKLWNFATKNPYLPIYADSHVLQVAQGQQKHLDRLYQQLGVMIPPSRYKHKFNIRESLDVSMPAPASKLGTADKTETPWSIMTLDGTAAARVGSEIATDALPFQVAVLMPSVGAGAKIGKSGTRFKFAGALLQPPHTLLSVARTYSHMTSLQLAKKVCDEVWLPKSSNEMSKLPAHLRKVYDLLSQIHKVSQDDKQAIAQLTNATNLLESLAEGFTKFEEHALDLLAVLKNDLHKPFFAQRYQLLRKEISAHQLLADRLSDHKTHNIKRAEQEIGRVWDTYSTALGIVEAVTVHDLAQYRARLDEQSEDLKLASHAFVAQYKKLAAVLAQPQLPFSQDHLYRYSVLSADSSISKDIGKTHFSVGGHFSSPAWTKGPTVDKEGVFKTGQHTLLGVEGGVTTVNTSVNQHPNPLRRGEFKHQVMSVDLSVPGVGELLLSRLSNANSNQNGKVNLKLDGQEAVNAVNIGIHSLATTLGLGDNDFKVTKTEAWRDGVLQYVALSRANEKRFAVSTPNLLVGTGGSLSFNKHYGESETKVQHLLGSDLAYHVLRFWEIEKHGIDAQIITQAKCLLDDEAYQRKDIDLFERFFNRCITEPAVKLTYFGMNGIGQLLHNFSQVDMYAPLTANKKGNQFEFIDFNAFKKEMTDIYFERAHIVKDTAKNLLASRSNSEDQNIFIKVGITPEKVKELLEQKVPSEMATVESQTITEFLDVATPDQRQAFFGDTDIGQQLFAAYLSIVNTARDIKGVFWNFPLSISEFAKRPAT